MVSPEFLYKCLNKMGLLNIPYEGQTVRRKQLQHVYVCVQNTIIWTLNCAHLYNTITRSTRYRHDFFQAVYEDNYLFIFNLFVNFIHFRSETVGIHINMIEKTFSKADKKVIKRCHHQSKILLVVIFCLISGSGTGAFLEANIPLSTKELGIRRMVYQTKHPERRHPYNLRFPFIDETESWAFEIILAFSVYYTTLYTCYMSLTMCILPITLIHVKGQYEILAKCIANIGKRHTNMFGDEIFYTNIKTNEFFQPPIVDRRGKKITEKVLKKRQHQYEQNYLKQIVQFHNELLSFHKTVRSSFLYPRIFVDQVSPVMILGIFCANLGTSLLLYQLVLFDPDLSSFRLVKVVIVLCSFMAAYFFLMNTSEVSDDCNGLLRDALLNSGWTQCSNETRKDICLLLLRVQRPHHLVFYNGFVVFSRVYFLKTMKIAYTFVNFMRIH